MEKSDVSPKSIDKYFVNRFRRGDMLRGNMPVHFSLRLETPDCVKESFEWECVFRVGVREDCCVGEGIV